MVKGFKCINSILIDTNIYERVIMCIELFGDILR